MNLEEKFFMRLEEKAELNDIIEEVLYDIHRKGCNKDNTHILQASINTLRPTNTELSISNTFLLSLLLTDETNFLKFFTFAEIIRFKEVVYNVYTDHILAIDTKLFKKAVESSDEEMIEFAKELEEKKVKAIKDTISKDDPKPDCEYPTSPQIDISKYKKSLNKTENKYIL